jgi:hypothetical protein
MDGLKAVPFKESWVDTLAGHGKKGPLVSGPS